MKLSTKGRYGLRALVDLTLNAKGDHVPLFSIAERQGISEQYLEHVFSSLRKAEIVKSVKGPRGGYTLAEAPSAIKISTVLNALEGSHSILKDLQKDGDDQINTIERAIRETLWSQVDLAVENILNTMTLEDLAQESIRLETGESLMFFI